MSLEILFVLLVLLGMIVALVLDKMRPGIILLSATVMFLCTGILSPTEMLEGFSNKGMITVGMLFLVSEGVRHSVQSSIQDATPDSIHIRIPEQHAGSRYLCTDYKKMGGIRAFARNQVLDTPFFCHHIGRNLYAYRDIYQPGCPWYDIGCRL